LHLGNECSFTWSLEGSFKSFLAEGNATEAMKGPAWLFRRIEAGLPHSICEYVSQIPHGSIPRAKLGLAACASAAEGRADDLQANALYIGGYKAGAFHGTGTLTLGDVWSYSGQFVDGMREGNGELTALPSAKQKGGALVRYKGGWSEDRFSGEGEAQYGDGTVYSGGFVAGKWEGSGRLDTPSFLHTGEFEQGLATGRGVRWDKKRRETTEGNFYAGVAIGYGNISGPLYIYQGFLKSGMFHGRGKLIRYTDEGNRYVASILSCHFVKGKACGYGELLDLRHGFLYGGAFADGGTRGPAICWKLGTGGNLVLEAGEFGHGLEAQTVPLIQRGFLSFTEAKNKESALYRGASEFGDFGGFGEFGEEDTETWLKFLQERVCTSIPAVQPSSWTDKEFFLRALSAARAQPASMLYCGDLTGGLPNGRGKLLVCNTGVLLRGLFSGGAFVKGAVIDPRTMCIQRCGYSAGQREGPALIMCAGLTVRCSFQGGHLDDAVTIEYRNRLAVSGKHVRGVFVGHCTVSLPDGYHVLPLDCLPACGAPGDRPTFQPEASAEYSGKGSSTLGRDVIMTFKPSSGASGGMIRSCMYRGVLCSGIRGSLDSEHPTPGTLSVDILGRIYTYIGGWSLDAPHGKGRLLAINQGSIVMEYEGDFHTGKFVSGSLRIWNTRGQPATPPATSDDPPHRLDPTHVSEEDFVTPLAPPVVTYTGTWSSGRLSGQGEMVAGPDSKIREYIGSWEAGSFHGRGTLHYKDGASYVGEFRHGAPGGVGELTKPEGYSYRGGFSNGKPDGKGREKLANGEVYHGEFHAGMREGVGSCVFSDGRKYSGQWEGGLPHGRGCMLDPNGTRYEGGFSQGREAGNCKIYYPDGRVVEGAIGV